MLTLSYEYKLMPSQSQIDEIERILAVCRQVWNYALLERKDWINSRKCSVNSCSLIQEYIIPADTPYPNYHIQAKRLTIARKANSELKSVNAQVLQQVLRKLDQAFADMKSQGLGFPRFKNYYRLRSFVFPQFKKSPVVNDSRGSNSPGWEIRPGSEGWVKLPQIGIVQMRLSRPIPEGFKVKQARVIRRASGYYVILSLQLCIDVPDTVPHGHPLGIDIGLESFLATSDGELVCRPKFLNKLHSELRLLQRRLKTKQKGSNNRKKLNRKIARLHETISNTRKDYHFKLAHHLCDQAGMIFVEDINFKAWAKGMLSQHTLDAGFGQFFQILSWVCWKRGVYFRKVNPNYTSQTCPSCGVHTPESCPRLHAGDRCRLTSRHSRSLPSGVTFQDGKKGLSEFIHKCSECGFEANRDIAAAMVICTRGQRGLENACGGELAGIFRYAPSPDEAGNPWRELRNLHP